MNDAPAVYRPRNPKASGWYRCVEDYFEEFVHVYDEQFAAEFGFWKPHIEKVIHRFLDCARLDGQYPKCAMAGYGLSIPGGHLESRPQGFPKIWARTTRPRRLLPRP